MVENVNLDARQICNWNWKGESESKVVVDCEIGIRGCRPRIPRGVHASFATARAVLSSPPRYCLLSTRYLESFLLLLLYITEITFKECN